MFSNSLPTIDLYNHIAQFKSELKGRKPSKTAFNLWKNNQDLQSWYCGEQVQLVAGNPYRTIPLDELERDFKVFIAKHFYQIAEVIWRKHTLFKNWIILRCASLVTTDNPMTYSSFRSVISHLQLFITHRQIKFLQDMWSTNQQLPAWFGSQEVNFANEARARIISKTELLEVFISALRSQRPKIIKLLWDNNLLLPAWFSRQEVNFGTLNNPDIHTISPSELIASFTIFLTSHCSEWILWIWDHNSLIRDWLTGKPVNFGTADAPDFRIITSDELRTTIKHLLASRCSKLVNELRLDERLKTYFEQPLSSEDKADENIDLSEQRIANFKTLLASHQRPAILQRWNKSSQLRSEFCYQHVNLAELTRKSRSVILKKLMANFKTALASRVSKIIIDMWQDPLFRDYFSGKMVNVGTESNPDFHSISSAEFLANFKSALFSRVKNVFESMWNENLAELIKSLYEFDRPAFNELHGIISKSSTYTLLQFKFQEIISQEGRKRKELDTDNEPPAKFSKNDNELTTSLQLEVIEEAFFDINSYLSVQPLEVIQEKNIQTNEFQEAPIPLQKDLQLNLSTSKFTLFSFDYFPKDNVFEELIESNETYPNYNKG